ncbi:MAG: hypothetical protein R2797_09775 [Gelidibacter sp.]
MKLTKQSKIDISLLIGSALALCYILFMQYAYLKKWDHTVLIAIMEFITIPIILIGCVIPIMTVFRFISKKTTNRTIAILTLFLSLLTAILMGYDTY